MDKLVLEEVAKALISFGKGILAADESTGTIKKRFDSVGVESTPENHRVYRQLLFKTPGIEEFISGVIMFDETIRQTTDEGIPFPKYLSERGIIPGIKVDKGTVDMVNFPGERITEGLDGLRDRLTEYKEMGAKFTKWRAVITVGENIPTDTCVSVNAEILAIFAAYSQEVDLVPIVEPEVIMDGTHNMDRSRQVTYQTLKKVFTKLAEYKVHFPGMLLKPNWIRPGRESGQESSETEVAKVTLNVLREVVPPQLPGIVFLSGGDSPEESTAYINEMNRLDDVPWQISFSFGRALQEPVLKTWAGKSENIEAAQKEFYRRAKLNSLARKGEYRKEMENGE